MKKNLLVFIIIFSINSKLNAQTWANPGATWYYSNNTTFYIGYYKIEKIGDTLINSFNCDNYLTTELIFNGSFNTIYNHEYTYQSNDTVYRWFDNQFVIFAIYNSSIGDTWSFPVDSSSCTSSGFFQVDSIGQTIINNDTLSVRYLTMVLPNLGSSQVTLTEKIGYSHTMFPYWSCTVDFYMPGPFRCYSDSSGFLYSSNIAPYCDFTTAISENSPDNRFIQIFPNPANDFCTINIEKLKNGTLILYDLMGRIILEENFNSQSSISLENFKEGTYLVKVIDEKGFTFRDKIIKK